jgi:hypothetical protein
MGGHFDGFHCWIAIDDKETQLNFFDTLMKSDHFIPVCMTYQAPEIARGFINEIVRLHGAPKRIIYDRGLVFTG